MTGKIWAVTLSDGAAVKQIELFDNAADADNYAHEMAASGNGHYQVIETAVKRREEAIANERRWADLSAFDSSCIECLVQGIATDQEKPFDEAACAKFLEDHKEQLQKEADDVVQELLKKRLTDYFYEDRVILG